MSRANCIGKDIRQSQAEAKSPGSRLTKIFSKYTSV